MEEEEKDPAATKQDLIDKIAQLNKSIDGVYMEKGHLPVDVDAHRLDIERGVQLTSGATWAAWKGNGTCLHADG